jgi:hypothetical protein
MPNQVYDDVDLESKRLLDTRDLRSAELRAITGMDDDKTDEQILRETEDREADSDGDDDDFSSKNDNSTNEEREALGLKSSALAGDDSDDYSDENENFAYSPRQEKNRNRLMGMISGKRGAGVATLGIAIAAGLGLTTLLAPLKLVGIMKTIDARYFAANNSALDEGTQRVVSAYIRNRIIPGLSRPQCKENMATRDCVALVDSDSSPLGQIFDRMKEVKYEDRLAASGLEFRKINGRVVMLVDKPDSPGLRAELADPNSGAQGVFEIRKVGGIDTLFDTTDKNGSGAGMQDAFTKRSDMRKMFNDKVRTTGQHNKLWHYYKLAGFAEKKYGIKKCFVACNLRDDYADWKDDKSRTIGQFSPQNVTRLATAKFLARVDLPMKEGTKLLVECLLSEACTEIMQRDDPANEERRTYLEKQMSQRVKALLSQGDNALVEKVFKQIGEIDGEFKGSASKYYFTKVFKNLVGEQIAKRLSNAIPIVGWIKMLDQVGTVLAALPKVVAGIQYTAKAAAVVGAYMTIRTCSDETTTGDTLGELHQGCSSLLGENNPSGDPLLAAEISPLFQEVMSSNPLQVVGLFGTSYAQSTGTTSTYPCDTEGKKYLQPDQIVCDNERFDIPSKNLDKIGEAGKGIRTLTTPYRATVGPIVNLISGPLEAAGSIAVAGAMKVVPGAEELVAEASKKAEESVIKVLEESGITETSISEKMNGPQLVNAVISGAELLGNRAASEELGLPEDKNGNVTAGLWNEIKEGERNEFMKRPLYARLFDSSDKMSLVSQLNLSKPQGRQAGPIAQVATLIKGAPSLLTSTTQTLVAVTAGRSLAQSAATNAYVSPVGLTTYALSPQSPVYDEIIKDGGYTEEQCKAMDEEWYKASRIDEKTKQVVYQTVNKCRLWKGTVFGTVGRYSANPNSDPELTAEPDVDTNYDTEGDTEDSTEGGGQSLGVAGLLTNPYVKGPDKKGYFQVLAPADGSYKTRGSTPPSEMCGSRALVDFIYTVSSAFGKSYPNNKILIGDLNSETHKSHNNGVDWDMYAVGGTEAKVLSDDQAIAMGKAMVDTGVVSMIFYNVPAVQKAVNDYAKNPRFMFSEPGHLNHFHVRLKPEYRGPYVNGCVF